MFSDIIDMAVTLFSLVTTIVFITRLCINYGHRKKPYMERRILDALTKYGCVEQPPLAPRTATAREVALLINNKAMYMRDPYIYDLQTACYLMDMEKSGSVGNSGETTDIPRYAVIKGRWYIKWRPLSV